VSGETFTPAGDLDRHWENYLAIGDKDALKARDEAVAYARERLEKTGIGGIIAEVAAAEFGIYVYVYSRLKNRPLSPGEWEREFVTKLDAASPVWVETPYGKKGTREVMRYGEVKYGGLRPLIDYMKVWVCTGPCPEGGRDGVQGV
jgi:hypothetical protein